MRRLLLLRHAKSAWPEGVEDHDRPLGDRGRRDAPVMGTYLASAGLQPDLVLVSSARRTQETWALVGPLLKRPCVARTVPSIYEAAPSAILAAIREVSDQNETLLVIGHNPGFEDLAMMLVSDGNADALDRLRTKYPTSGLVVIEFDMERWVDVAPGSARLEVFVSPKTLS